MEFSTMTPLTAEMFNTPSVPYTMIMTPAEKHYQAIKRAVKKYQDANRDVCRERCRNWAKNLKNDPERYQKYLEEKNEYMKKYRLKKTQSVIPDEIMNATIGIGSKGHNQENKIAIPISFI